MRSRYKSFAYAALATTGFAAFFLCLQMVFAPELGPPEAAKPARPAPEVSEKAMADIQSAVEKQEYHISYDPKKKILQSPNRKHNLRAYYEPGKLTVQTRVDTTGHHFKLELINEGIFADGKPLYLPQSNARAEHHDNKLHWAHDAFTEEFINSDQGVRQNFIIDNAPQGTQQLQVKIVANGLDVTEGTGEEIRFYSKSVGDSKRDELVYSDLKCWDANKKPLPANLAFTEGHITISVDVANATYPVTIDPIITNGTPQNANKVIEVNQSSMWLGFSVSSAGDVNGDGYSDIIVGAPLYDKTKANEGAAIVFKGTANGLSLSGEFLVCGQDSAQMGYAVSTAGDFNGDGFSDVMVGIPYYNTNVKDAGQVRLYFGSANGITPQSTYISYSSANALALTGVSVATAGDINGDGFSDVLIGVPQDTDGESKEGLVRVCYGGTSNNLNTNYINLQCNQANALYGFSATSAGDVNGDGFSDVVVGARFYDGQSDEGTLVDAGAIFIYHGSASGLATSPVFQLVGTQQDSRLGHKVNSAGDINGDGYSDVLLSCYLFDSQFQNEGIVYLLRGSGVGISLQNAQAFYGGQTDARIGSSVACAGDVNGDGYADIMLGAQYYDNGQNNEGAVFIYHGSANGVSATPVSTLESNQNEGWFGTAVASAGDVNGDGYSDILVGCYTFDNGQVDEGHVFLYHGGAEGVGTNNSLSLPGSDPGSLMGMSVANAGDVNGDGFDEVIVGAPQYDLNGTTGGIAILYYGSINGITLANNLILSKNMVGSYFGGSVAGLGDVDGNGYDDIIVGAQLYSNGQNQEGVAFIYYGSNGGINAAAGQLIEKNNASANFGASVSAAGDVNRDGFADVVIGAPQFLNGLGAIYIYHGSANGLVNPTTIQGYNANSGFGYAVSTGGDINGDGYSDVLAGAATSNLGELDEGAFYIFYGTSGGINSAGKVLQSNHTGANLGASVSSAGDVNGDGFGDIVVGAPYFDKGQPDEGIAVIYYGSGAGINEVAPVYSLLEVNAANASFGSSVKSAGDVNGDGYGDVIIGAPHFENGQVNEGSIFVFHGSPTGIKPTPSFNIESENANSQLGLSVSDAGDVNGDGYSDVVAGAPLAAGTGTGIVLYGNNGKGLRNNVRLYNSDQVNPISYNQFNQPTFAAGLFTRSFIGKNKGKLVWETKGPGTPFSQIGTYPITTSNQYTGISSNFTTISGQTVIKDILTKSGISTKVRVRVRYAAALAITGQIYGPWRYVQSQLAGYNNAPVPQVLAEEERHFDKPNLIAYPNPASDKLFIETGSPDQVQSVRLVTLAGKTVFNSDKMVDELSVSHLQPGAYVLITSNKDGSHATRKIIVKK